MQVRFLFAEDKDFTKSGRGINYAHDFEYYKKTLIVSANNPGIQNVFVLWNNYLFGTPAPAITAKGAEELEVNSPEVNEMLQVIASMCVDSGVDSTPTTSTILSLPPAPTPTSSPLSTPDVTPLSVPEDLGAPAETTETSVDVADEETKKTTRGGNAPQGTKKAMRGSKKAPAGGQSRPRTRWSRAQVTEVEVSTEEDDHQKSGTGRLTRQGASEQIISITCGDEEGSD